MNLQSQIDKETIGLDKLRLIQLPNKFKKIGWLAVIVGFSTLLLNGIVDVQDGIKIIAKYLILLGLLVVSISRETIEDERINSIRMQSYSIAFLMAVFCAFFIPTVVYFKDKLNDTGAKFEDVGDFVILWTLLAIQIFYFNIKKKQTA